MHLSGGDQSHTLYLGTRYLGNGATVRDHVSITVDGVSAGTVNLLIGGEDVLFRYPVGSYAAGVHTVTVDARGAGRERFLFRFLRARGAVDDICRRSRAQPRLTLATDWDTEHSLALAPERTAWMIDSLGFTGRQNHYVGALWFYELVESGEMFTRRRR